MTYRKKQTLMALYPENVILDVPERTNTNAGVSRQNCTMTYPTTLYHDVPERTNSNGFVSQQRYTMTYQKEQTLMALYPDNVIL